MIASALLGYEFWNTHLYGSSILQIIYIAISAYGWYKWNRTGDDKEYVKICHTTLKQWASYTLSGMIIGIISYVLLKYFKDDSYLMDAVLTAICIIATYMATLKQIEGWFIFAGVGLLSAILYYSYNLYFTSLTYIVFGILDFLGGIRWLSNYRQDVIKSALHSQ